MIIKNDLYKRGIITELYFNGQMSCADLSMNTDKSIPLTTKILNELIEEGFVVETGYANSTGGRRPLMFSLKPDILYVVSVAMDQFVTRMVLMDMENHYVSEVEKFELNLYKEKDSLSTLTENIEAFIQKLSVEKEKIAGIGIAMPGFVDAKKGLNYSLLHSDNRSISEHISGKTGLPVFIDNDSSLIALAELRFGNIKHRKDAMVVNIGWGIGLGMIVNGKMFRGYNGFAGEFSHIPLFTNDKLCSCGKKGCLETETSLFVIIEKAKKSLGEGRVSILQQRPMNDLELASESILSAAADGDQFAVELLSDAGYKIGKGIAVLIHILNPETIVLSGRGAAAGKLWLAPIQQSINENCIPRIAANTTIELSNLGYDAELAGAAALVMENFEKKPVKEYNTKQAASISN
ncbi:MAG: ROK family protein [Parafilimonas sp.]|nr:ROK family protein [Parafilimonas sp.]